ncbi:ribosome hibernation-promoting factor, HPF/YfiA family [Haploplasma axanthum]|uniref:Ribosome hibernation promoting factor n=1 Tax=Haploplasma axanthum TaxID=29552 RepID=A0A449BFC7_HAPAX|nr:ribosome-associated translation inhibitor RaiA [Haploplasma axanthum]VEU81141.1 Ribosome-associated factor Y [Haploplasma axanthum]
MKIEVIGKNGFIPTEAIRKYAEKKLDKVVSMFGDDTVEKIRVVTKVYSDHHKVEVTVIAKGKTIRAEVTEVDMYAAIDKSIDKLVSQIRRYKDKLNSHFEKEGIKNAFSSEFDAESLEKEMFATTLVKNKKIELIPLTADEAIVEMELAGHDFYVFLDKATNKTNVVYRRIDGDYAIIETE